MFQIHIFFFSSVISFSKLHVQNRYSLGFQCFIFDTLVPLCVLEKIAVSLLCAIWFDRVKSFWIAEAVGCRLSVTSLCRGTHQVQGCSPSGAPLSYSYSDAHSSSACSDSLEMRIYKLNKNVIVKKWIVWAKYHIPRCGKLSYLNNVQLFAALCAGFSMGQVTSWRAV